MRYLLPAAGVLAVLLAADAARAISTLQDTVGTLPRISRVPSTMPPNPAVRRDFQSKRQNIGTERATTVDEGPDPDAPSAPVTARAAPYTVAISEGEELNQDFLCAGVVIAPNWILTAAHCTFNIARRWPNDAPAYVFLDTVNLSAPGRRLPVKEIIVHPEYDPVTLKSDVALLRVEPPADKPMVPIKLEGPPISSLLGEIASILGWGITGSRHNLDHKEHIQVVQFAVMDQEVCFSSTVYPGLRQKGVFCARTLLKHLNVCFRFGGSPVVIYDRAGALYLAGIVAWPAECPGDTRKPNAFLDVQYYVPWIKTVIGGKQGA